MPFAIAPAALPFWVACGVALLTAIGAGVGDLRRRRRGDFDRIGWIDWPTLQILALIAAAMLAIVALNA